MMNQFFVLFTFLGIFVSADCSALDKYSFKPGSVYHGRYTRDIKEAELLVPRRVFKDGNFNTYSLPNFYGREELNERKKRSPETDSRSLDLDKIHLLLPFNGIDHHVELTPYHDFISPDMVIETRGAGISDDLDKALRFKRAPDQQCHYRGTVRGHGDSRAALSLCDGVVGYVQTNHGRYFIEPANEAEPEPDGQHVHIVYKRDALHENNLHADAIPKSHCGTNDDWESAWAEQLAKRQKRLMATPLDERKRALAATHSIHRYIEIGLVADRRFLDFHNNTNYEQYLLTLMNMVADFYHDNSCGNQIDVVVVRMIYLEKEKEEIDLVISTAAEDTLSSFAAWADKVNPKDHTHPNHFDVSVLVTRYDICSDGTECQLLGLAYIATACDSAKAASINEDTGLVLGVVIAHEVGHVMGCLHDTPELSGCVPRNTDDSYFVMSPSVHLSTIKWSPCSRKFITVFLDSGLGDCLNDDPKNPPDKFKYPNMLPGAMYDTNFQCNMQFPGSKLCEKSADCSVLWCKENSTCVSKWIPMAEGSKCGENKWCIHKKCVDIGTRPAAVNGGWSDWGSLTPCSRSCGGGVSYSERECNNPVPANGGRYCIGERKRVSICNTMPCDPLQPSYRAVLCTEKNNESILEDGKHVWLPVNDIETEPCALECVNELDNYVKLSPVVNDSTPCRHGTNDMCIAGVCRKVGCDWVIDSNAIEDKCGICNGDGTKCTAVEGYFKNSTKDSGYLPFLTVPKGARSVYVWEDKLHENMLAVKPVKDKDYCLNGNFFENRDGEYICAGVVILYSHPEIDKEKIIIKGPLAEDLEFAYVYFKRGSNPGIYYKYAIMSANASYTPKYIWDFIDWSECDAKCGGGTMISEASCIEEHGGKVSLQFCDGTPRPEPKSRICNAEPCPAKWRVSQWSRCNACDGKNGTRHRKVQCVKPAAHSGEDDVQANLDACKGRVPKQTVGCVGTRPCRKTCPKKVRSLNNDDDIEKQTNELTLEDERKMIDRVIDLGLTRYLENVHRISRKDNIASMNSESDIELLLRDWPHVNENKEKRNCATQKPFTTPKPGTIVKDPESIENIVLLEAPYVETNLQGNLSDKAFRESGEVLGGGIDTTREKVYKGVEALKRIEKINHRNSTRKTRSGSSKDSRLYDNLLDSVDEFDE